jgi:hypothetical protein
VRVKPWFRLPMIKIYADDAANPFPSVRIKGIVTTCTVIIA